MRSVLLSHPHAAAFATGAAAGLARAGLLAGYWTGVGAAEGSARGRLLEGLGRRRPTALNRLLRGVPPERVRALPLVELGARAVGRAAARRGLFSAYDAVFVAHDRAVALGRWPSGLDAVYAYEDGALATFRRAERAGLQRVWDLPLPHYAFLERMWREESARWPEAVVRPPVEPTWKKQRKDAELALATTVSVASAFTRASLEELGGRAPVVVTPYGFPASEFSPKAAPNAGPFTVVAVGSQDLRKGTPYLLEAWRRAGLRDARLRLVGPLRLAKPFFDRYAGLFEHTPHVPRANLGEVYRGADLLAFPTLGDGFGMVLQEAMCCGTPVVTTRCGGGPECITDGQDGWLVPERDPDALAERLVQASRERDRLFAMGRAARARAERYTWTEAGDALARALRG